MTCDLKTNKSAMMDAFEDVRGDGDNDWVVFGYEKDNRTLKVNETGEDGYEEMVDELGETKAVYAIIKMKDPNSGLPKMVQINWLPDGLPASIKAVVSRHVTDVERFFPGVHVRLNARYEDDVTEKALLAKVAKASGANYGIHKEKKKDYGPIEKTGTNYVKTDASKEVDVKSRNEYMNKQHQDDQKRIEEEQKRRAAERAQADQERRERESQEAAKRNEVVERKAQAVLDQKQREAEERRQEEEAAKQRWRDEQMAEAERMTEEERVAEEEKMRRWEEERERISGAKAATMSEEDRQEAWLQEKERRWEEERESIRQQRAEATVEDVDPDAERRMSKEAAWEEERAKISAHVRSGQTHQEEEEEEEQQQQPEQYQEEEPQQQYQEEEPQEEAPAADESSGSGVSVRVIYDYQAEDDTEISLEPEEVLFDVDQGDENWWTGTKASGQRGMFPANYVEVC